MRFNRKLKEESKVAIPKLLEKMRNSVQTSGGTMTGDLILSADPDQNLEAATKQYVDNNSEVFWAFYGMTTYEEVINAYSSGKIIFSFCQDSIPESSHLLSLYTSPGPQTTELYFMPHMIPFTNNIDSPIKFTILKSDNTWTTSTIYQNQFKNSIYLSSESTTPLDNSNRYYRPILTSTQEPTASDGNVGDIWIVYTE